MPCRHSGSQFLILQPDNHDLIIYFNTLNLIYRYLCDPSIFNHWEIGVILLRTFK